MKFRLHRGGLAESMETVVEIEDREELVKHINKKHSFGPKLTSNDLSINPYGYDARIKWDTHIVTIPYGVIGFLDGYLK